MTINAMVHLHLDQDAPLPATTRELAKDRGFLPNAAPLRFTRPGWPLRTAAGLTFAERHAARSALVAA